MNTSVLIFWIIIIGMTIIAMSVLALPWLHFRTRATVVHENPNLAVYRDRMYELETALDYPFLTFAQREQERHKLTRELLDDIAPTTEFTPEIRASGHGALVMVITALPVTALLLYALLGTGSRLFSPMAVVDEKIPAIEQIVAKLAARLQTQPNDPQGWTILARSYVALERYPEAVAAYARVTALTGAENPDLAVDYAEALVLANGNQITVEARALLTKLLQQAPDHPKGLWLAGVWAFHEERYQEAMALWLRVKSLLPADSELINEVDSAIANARDAANSAKP